MKYKILIITILFFLLIKNFGVLGAEKKNSIAIGPYFNTYTGYLAEGYKRSQNSLHPVNMSPGIELTYFRNINNNVEVGTGICYSYANTYSAFNVNEFVKSWQLHFNEINIPFLLRFFIWQKSDYPDYPDYITCGINLGSIFEINSEFYVRDWHKRDITSVPYFSSDQKYADILFDIGWLKQFKNLNTIAFAPFCKYRLNTTWLNHHHRKFQYGFKLIYAFKF